MGNARAQDVQINCPSAIMPLFCADEDTPTRSREPHSVHANHSTNLGSISSRLLLTSISFVQRLHAQQPTCHSILQCVFPGCSHSAPQSRSMRNIAPARGG